MKPNQKRTHAIPPIVSAIRRDQRSFFHAALLCAALWVLTVSGARAVDVEYLELFKGQAFTQTETNSPTLAATNPFLFQTFADTLGYPTTYFGDVTDPVIHTPAGSSHPLALTAQTYANGAAPATNFSFSASAASQSALDTAYGAGAYALTYTGEFDGAASIAVPLSEDSFPPAPPSVSNLVAAQTIDPSADFTLSFAAWDSSDTNDIVQLTVLDSGSNVVFATPSLLAIYPQVPLSATNISIVISNGTLTLGRDYTATLAYFEVTTNFSSDGSPPYVWAGFFSQTTFTIHAGTPTQTNSPPPPPASPASLTGTVLTLTISNGTGPFASGGTYEILTGPAGSNYTVLGNAGAGFGSGGFVYTQTGTNTGTITFTDAKAGVVSLELAYNSAGAGTFSLTGSSGMQTGAFAAALPYSVCQPAKHIFAELCHQPIPGLSQRRSRRQLHG